MLRDCVCVYVCCVVLCFVVVLFVCVRSFYMWLTVCGVLCVCVCAVSCCLALFLLFSVVRLCACC